MGGAFRRFYLYSALSIAVLALSFAAGAILTLALRAAGLELALPTPDDVRMTVAFAIAVALVATPVGAVHLVLIRRGLRDPAELSSDVRHFYLNAWILVALLVSLATGESVASASAPGTTSDRSGQVAAILVSAIVAVIAWRWRRIGPAPRPRWERLAIFIAMVVAMVVATIQVASAVGALGQLWALDRGTAPPRFGPPPRSFLDRTVWTGSFGAAWAMAIWAVGAVWQWRRGDVRGRLTYLVTGYAIGVTALLAAGAVQLGQLVRAAIGRGGPQDLVIAVGPLAAAILLVGVHGAWILVDRRRAEDRGLYDRAIAAPPALVGLALLGIGLAQAWTVMVRDVLIPAAAPADARDGFALAAGSIVVGLVAYPLSWRALLRASTAGEPVRRFAIFTAMCLALLAGVAAAAAALYNVISLIIGLARASDAPRDAASAGGAAAIAAAIFASHLVLFLRDRRERPDEVTRDELLETLEAVARGELTPHDASARIRG